MVSFGPSGGYLLTTEVGTFWPRVAVPFDPRGGYLLTPGVVPFAHRVGYLLTPGWGAIRGVLFDTSG